MNTQVGVSGNELGPEGGKAIADALQTNVALQSIEIGSNDNPAIIPIKQLRDNSVDVLDYSGKKLLSEGGIVLAAALAVTQNMSVTTVSDIVQFCRLDLKMLIRLCSQCLLLSNSHEHAGRGKIQLSES